MLKRRFYLTFIVIILFIVIGYAYQKYGVEKDMKVLIPPGKIEDVNGHGMHIYAQGRPDSNYKLVLAAGSGTTSPYADFYPLYSRIDQQQRVILYERPGYGWSEPLHKQQNVDIMAKDLHELFTKSGESGPYILLAHSMGSLELINYAMLYPNEVAGIVLIDGISPDYAIHFEQTILMKLGWGAMSLAKNSGILRALSKLGITDRMFVDIDDLPKELKEIKVAMALKNLNNPDMKLEMQSMSENGRLLKEKGDLGDLPMLVISATNNGYKNWEQTQSELLLLSSRATHVVFPDTKHYIHHVKSDQIIEEINKFIKDIKQKGNN